MRIIKRFTIISFLVMFVFATPYKLLAQPIDPCTDPQDPCPIDSNLIVLIVGALVVAAKKSYDYKRTSIVKQL